MFLQHYTQVLKAEDEAYQWLEDLWVAVEREWKLSAASPPAHWTITPLSNKDGATRTSSKHSPSDAANRRPHGVRAERTLSLTTKRGTSLALGVELRDRRCYSLESSIPQGKLYRLTVSTGNKDGLAGLRDAMGGRTRLDVELADLAKVNAWDTRPDSTQVLWTQDFSARLDGDDLKLLVREGIKALEACETLGAYLREERAVPHAI